MNSFISVEPKHSLFPARPATFLRPGIVVRRRAHTQLAKWSFAGIAVRDPIYAVLWSGVILAADEAPGKPCEHRPRFFRRELAGHSGMSSCFYALQAGGT